MRRQRWTNLCLIFSLVLLLCGCSDNRDKTVRSIRLRSGHGQTNLPGQVLPKPLVVEVLGPHQPGLLGGKGSDNPVCNATVRFSLEDPSCAAELVGPAEVKTDAGGMAWATLRLGPKFGDCYVRASVDGPEGEPLSVVFRAVSGVVIRGGGQEGPTGEVLGEPVIVKVADAAGPVMGVPVYFAPEAGEDISVTKDVAETDRNGEAQTFVRLGKKAGAYHLTAEVADPQRRYVARGLTVVLHATNNTTMFLTMLGGLALFILGIRMMSESLQRSVGKRLRSVVQLFARNRFVGILTGTIVTAAIQSSSACTVMAIGFVNAGLLTLRQAIGVIYGANIGTTVTGQIVAFRLDTLALPAVAIGLLVSFIGHNRKWKFWGEGVMGFGLLFLGMEIMTGSLEPLGGSPSFIEFFRRFDCSPVHGWIPVKPLLLATVSATLFTMLVQSSVAAIGLTFVLAATGLINFYTAIPLVFGPNIGTTITAVLASLGANRMAKRAACTHALFNIIGTLYMIGLLYVTIGGVPVFVRLVDSVVPGPVLGEHPVNIERHIAVAHTLFNVMNVVVFLPFVGGLAVLAQYIIPLGEAEKERQLQYLEPHLLDTPSLALDQAIKEVAYVTRLAKKSIEESMEDFVHVSAAHAAKLREREDRIDDLQHQITNYLVLLSQRELTDAESTVLPMLIHAVNDAERVGDHAQNVVELTERRIEEKLPLSDNARDELLAVQALVIEQFDAVLLALEKSDTHAAKRVLQIEDRINTKVHDYHEAHVRRLETGECHILSGVVYLDLLANLEKVGDHLTNIGERSLRVAKELDGLNSDAGGA